MMANSIWFCVPENQRLPGLHYTLFIKQDNNNFTFRLSYRINRFLNIFVFLEKILK